MTAYTIDFKTSVEKDLSTVTFSRKMRHKGKVHSKYFSFIIFSIPVFSSGSHPYNDSKTGSNK
jgi:hypothetical protein